MTSTIEDATVLFERTAGLTESVHPFQGGRHAFRVEEGDGNAAEIVLSLNGGEFFLDSHAFETACKAIPGGSDVMASRWPLSYVIPPLNWFFDNRSGEFKLITIEDCVVAITKPNSYLFDPGTILDKMVQQVGKYGGTDGIVVDHLSHSLDQTRFTVRPAEGQAERYVDAKPGDRTIGSLTFEGSLLGKHPNELSVSTHRVECGNGMISVDGVRRFLADDDLPAEHTLDALGHWVDDTCAQLFGGSPMDQEFERIRHLTDHDVEGHLADVLADLFARLRIPVNAQPHIHDALEEEEDGTMYGVVQAITRAATHAPSMTAVQRANLMRAASAATLHAQTVCDSCKRPTY